MCLAVPAQILSRDTERAQVSCDGLELEVDASLVPEAKVGDYVIIHVGIALSVMNAEEALLSLQHHREFSLTDNSEIKE
jgi:hydrogenase expression/formation protein HypC